jgi:hypothetical protein
VKTIHRNLLLPLSLPLQRRKTKRRPTCFADATIGPVHSRASADAIADTNEVGDIIPVRDEVTNGSDSDDEDQFMRVTRLTTCVLGLLSDHDHLTHEESKSDASKSGADDFLENKAVSDVPDSASHTDVIDGNNDVASGVNDGGVDDVLTSDDDQSSKASGDTEPDESTAPSVRRSTRTRAPPQRFGDYLCHAHFVSNKKLNGDLVDLFIESHKLLMKLLNSLYDD